MAGEKPAHEEWQDNLNMHLICPDCKEIPPNLVEEFSSGDMVCGDCGLVLGSRIVDTRSEWRTFSNDDQNTDDPSRVGEGPNLLLNGEQLQTDISFGDGGKGSRDLNRVQSRITQDKGNKALLQAYKDIGANCERISLPKTVSDHAKHLYKVVTDAGILKGKTQDSIQAGCIFIACRHCNLSRSFREIMALTSVPKKEIGRIFKILEKFFTTQSESKSTPQMETTTSTKPPELCIRFCSSLNLGAQITKVSQALAERMCTEGALAGRSPLSGASACIFYVSHLMKDPRSAKDIAKIAGVSDGTIRTSYKLLYEAGEQIVDPEWIKDGKGDISLLPKI